MKGFNCCTYVIIYFNTIIQEIEDLPSIKILLFSVLNAMRMKTCATYAFFIEISFLIYEACSETIETIAILSKRQNNI